MQWQMFIYETYSEPLLYSAVRSLFTTVAQSSKIADDGLYDLLILVQLFWIFLE